MTPSSRTRLLTAPPCFGVGGRRSALAGFPLRDNRCGLESREGRTYPGPKVPPRTGWGTLTPVGDSQLPASLRRRDDRAAIFEDIAPYLGTTVAQRSEILGRLCRLAAEQLAAHPDAERLRAWQDPRSPESERLWLALVSRHRQGG